MAGFNDTVALHEGAKTILMGNRAFALGAIHAGIAYADGYPGTPTSEVIDTLRQVPECITASWSVNEAVALGSAVGFAIGGKDALATMKVPGLFQAADVLVSSAFSEMFTGALILYVATDNEPSSSQYVMDVRPFLHSIFVPIVEPKNHQDLYEAPRIAAELSRKEQCPVVILVSSILAHAESEITVGTHYPKTTTPEYAGRTIDVIPLPPFARKVYDKAVLKRMDGISATACGMLEPLAETGTDNWGIICVGYTYSLAKDALLAMDADPHVLSISLSNPLSLSHIKEFRASFPGNCYLIEESGTFVEHQLKLNNIDVLGKEKHPTLTHWTTQSIYSYLKTGGESIAEHLHTSKSVVFRPPAICAGCPYRGVSSAITLLKKQGTVSRVFGDIGCSSLLSLEGVFDYSLCMGASDSMRQGYVQAKPEEAWRVLSLIGDSSECHSGMDASRNSQFKNIPGVKIILDNSAVAMTGYQDTPTSNTETGISLKHALEGENISAIEVDGYNSKAVRNAIKAGLEKAKACEFTAIIVKGSCIHVVPKKKGVQLSLNTDLCTKCGICGTCHSITFGSGGHPIFNTCSLCGGGTPLCIQSCPSNAIRLVETAQKPQPKPQPVKHIDEEYAQRDFTGTFKLGVYGVGGQGNLFIGKVLARVVQKYFRNYGNIVKGEVHGMSQMVGPVTSTFSFGNTVSPLPLNQGMDILLSLEQTELFRGNALSKIKPNGRILLSDRTILPRGLSREDYPSKETILQELSDYRVLQVSIPEKYSNAENVFMLGVLSAEEPFDKIPDVVWQSVLSGFSRNNDQALFNIQTFMAGKLN